MWWLVGDEVRGAQAAALCDGITKVSVVILHQYALVLSDIEYHAVVSVAMSRHNDLCPVALRFYEETFERAHGKSGRYRKKCDEQKSEKSFHKSVFLWVVK